MGSFRTPEADARYHAEMARRGPQHGCALCIEEPLIEYKYWKKIVNNFPYDKIASLHHMLVPLRHVTEEELTQEEKDELMQLKHSGIKDEYEFYIEGAGQKSIPGHYHLHLVNVK